MNSGEPMLWAGVDVGGRKKGFHAALIDSKRLLALEVLESPDKAARWLRERRPRLVAVDSPFSPAPQGERSRPGERQLAAARICSIRYTPDRAGLASSPTYYEWIEQGFLLYETLRKACLAAIECFPTASWTRWAGPRGTERRSDWSQRALAASGLAGIPSTLNQDARDAIGAALTARAHEAGETERFGEIVVPKAGRRRLELGAQHALIQGLREGGSEVELTRALAAVFSHERRMAAAFLRLVVKSAPRGRRIDLRDLPEELSCVSEQRVAEGVADLTFADAAGGWHAIVEIKIHAGYGHDQIERYLRSFRADAQRTVLAAITRDVPTYGDYQGDDRNWAGSVRWARLLPGLRGLKPENTGLATQWPLFLEVLEKEGSMGFTAPQASLFQAWAQYPDARKHVVDFVDSVRTPLLEALQAATAESAADQQTKNLAKFVTKGKSQVAVVKHLGKIFVRFQLGAPGPEWIQAGVWGWREPRFFVEVPYPKDARSSEAAAACVSALKSHRFEPWKDQILTRYLPLDQSLLERVDLEEEVIAFARECFGQIAASGIVGLESEAVLESLETEEAV